MHIPDVHDYDGEPHQEKVQEFLSQGSRKKIQDAIKEIVSEEFDRLEDYAGDHITQVAAHRAERFLERVLKGDENAAMALLGDKDGGSRYRGTGWDAEKPWAHLIHGELFTTETVKLRKQIVEAHPELLRSERIKDLESQVEGLSQQVRELEGELEYTKERLR